MKTIYAIALAILTQFTASAVPFIYAEVSDSIKFEFAMRAPSTFYDGMPPLFVDVGAWTILGTSLGSGEYRININWPAGSFVKEFYVYEPWTQNNNVGFDGTLAWADPEYLWFRWEFSTPSPPVTDAGNATVLMLVGIGLMMAHRYCLRLVGNVETDAYQCASTSP